MVPLLSINWLHMPASIFGLYVLFTCSICLSCQYHTRMIINGFIVKSWNHKVSLPTFFHFQVVLAILKSLEFPWQFKNQLATFYKRTFWDFDYDCIEPTDQSGENWRINDIESPCLLTGTCFAPPFILVFLNFSQDCFVAISCIFCWIYSYVFCGFWCSIREFPHFIFLLFAADL